MFWEKWIPAKYLIKSNVCGLEVLVTENGFKFFHTIISNKNNKLSIVEHGVSENKPELPAKIVKDKIPLIVTIVGKGLISKKVSLPEGEINYEEVLLQNMPALDKNDFYIQLYPQRGCDAYINIFRKSQVDSILKAIKETKSEIADVFLGYSFISDVTPLTSLFDRVIANNVTIEITNSCVESVKQENSDEKGSIKIEDLALDKTNVLGFALSFVYLLNSKRHYNYNNLGNFSINHLERNKFKILSRAAIALAFILCLINFLFFNYFFGKNKKLETELNLYESKYQQINELLSSYEKKRHLIEEAGILNEEGFTQNVDKIASTIPAEVVLTDLVVNPIIKKTEEDSLIKFTKNSILIKGNCDKSLIVNEWVHVLKSKNFIADINLNKFIYKNEGNQPNFEINISVK